MNRCFFCEQIPEPGDAVVLSSEESRHAEQVLRARRDENLMLLDGNGTLAIGQVTSRRGKSKSHRISCEIITKETLIRPGLEVSLYVAPPRQKSMSLLIRQAVELGVSEITPIITQHTMSKPHDNSLAGWRKDALEACKQARNPFLPEIQGVIQFNQALEDFTQPGIFGTAPRTGLPRNDGNATALAAIQMNAGGAVSVWIGPEGGFTDSEIETMIAKELVAAQIGHWTLRIETAVVALLTLVNLTGLQYPIPNSRDVDETVEPAVRSVAVRNDNSNFQ